MTLALTILIAIDFRVRSVASSVRIVNSTLAYIVVISVVCGILIRAYRFRPTELTVARWIESHDARWHSRLSSAIEFTESPKRVTSVNAYCAARESSH